MRIVLRVVRGRDLDPGELLAGGAIVVHVAHGTHAIGIMRGRAVSGLEIGFRAGRARRHHAGARFPGERDQRDRALARRDRFRGMTEMDDVGTAAGLGGIDVAELFGVEAEIVDHRPGAAGRVARAEIAVDIVLAEPGILDRALGDLGVELGGGFVRRMPGRVFVDPGNVGLALDGQNRGLRSRFLLPRFSEPHWPCWQARKYSVGREGSRWAQVGDIAPPSITAPSMVDL
ncbi:hypothetical protein BD122_19806 [Bradyrhizobium diazoefficiens]|nr:hypothetical protein BD122_19806 [Bradyrhizobium diazoefficiens]